MENIPSKSGHFDFKSNYKIFKNQKQTKKEPLKVKFSTNISEV